MTTPRRSDRLGIHSIGEFCLRVPDLATAHRFYTCFGLDVTEGAGGELLLRTPGSPHVWGRLREGRDKRFESLTWHCFEEDLAPLQARAREAGVPMIEPPPGADAAGFWFRNAEGVAWQVRVGPKTTLDAAQHVSPPLPVDGVRCAPYRRLTAPVQPRRLSHIAFVSGCLPVQVDFCLQVLGLRLSDRSGDGVAFLHAPHGGDHHLVAFAAGPGAALHHLSWDVPTVEDVGLGWMQMQAAGYTEGWGVGRHVLGSNYFYYARDPWGSFCEYSATMDYIPAALDWEGLDHPPEDGLYLWGPPLPPVFLVAPEPAA